MTLPSPARRTTWAGVLVALALAGSGSAGSDPPSPTAPSVPATEGRKVVLTRARAERIVARNDDWTRAPKVGSHVTIDGSTFFHLAGPTGQGRWYDVYASPDGDRLLHFGFKTAVRRAQRKHLVGSVLASVRLR